ncbi:MAG: protein kinase [Halobacteriota archaeon]
MAQSDPETIRKVVSNKLNDLLSDSPQEELYVRFQEFCKVHRFPLNRAFFKDEEDGFRVWFGYELTFPSLGRGNFGEVFHAHDGSGADVAIKILHENILGDTNMLGGFRRGVRSMRFLSDANIGGVVRLVEAFDLPPTIVTEYISGYTLQDALEARLKLPWTIKLRVMCKVAEIVYRSHSLPMTVIHRDLKPSNIMIRNFDFDAWFEPEVIVLDFDMSWHKGSNEKDVVFESRDDFGYLAPEQTTQLRGVSAVSTRVDSYGLGMTTFYLFGGQHPRPNEELSDRWLEHTLRAAKTEYEEKWLSAPNRLARLIKECTRINQVDRMDFSLAFKELQNLLEATSSPSNMRNPELWAEEVLAQLPSPAAYVWDINESIGRIQLERGIAVSCKPDFRNACVEIQFEFISRGSQQYKLLSQKLESVPQHVRRILEDGSWKWEKSAKGLYQVTINASIEVSQLIQYARAAFKAAGEAFKAFESITGIW